MANLVNVRKLKYYKPRVSPQVEDFRSLFRFSEESVEWLANHFFGLENFDPRGGALTPIHKIKVCLRYLADPGFQKGIGEELGVHQSTVSLIVREVVKKIVTEAGVWIRFPSNPVSIHRAKEQWRHRRTFPTAIGVIDCTHIGIEKPRAHGDEYVNRKGKPTINVQATCDGNYRFTSVDVSWPGSVHDSRIWKNSYIRTIMATTTNTVLLGDSGYGIEPWLMVPFRNPEGLIQEKFNKLLARERVLIEQSFGQVKRRFPILKYVCRVKLENIPDIVVACVVLHNIAKAINDPDFEDEVDASEDVLEPFIDHPQDGDNLRVRGQQVRRTLADIINQFS